MRLSDTGFTLPWQAVAAQEPGPMYLAWLGDGEDCAPALAGNKVHAHRASAGGKTRRALDCIAEKREIFRMNALWRASLLSSEQPGSQRRRIAMCTNERRRNTRLFTVLRTLISMQ